MHMIKCQTYIYDRDSIVSLWWMIERFSEGYQGDDDSSEWGRFYFFNSVRTCIWEEKERNEENKNERKINAGQEDVWKSIRR